MQVLRARGVESEAQIPFASLLELLRPAVPMLERIPAPAGHRARGRVRAAAGAGAGSLRRRRGDAQPARRLRRARARSRCCSTTSTGSTTPARRRCCSPFAASLPTRSRCCWPRATTSRRCSYDADLPTIRVGGLSSDEAAALLGGLAPALTRTPARGHRGQPAGAARAGRRRRRARVRSRGRAGARLGAHLARVSETGTRRSTRRPAVRWFWRPPVTRGRPSCSSAPPVRSSIDLAALAAAESAGLITLRAGTVEFRHAARPVGDLRRRAGAGAPRRAPGAGGSAP